MLLLTAIETGAGSSSGSSSVQRRNRELLSSGREEREPVSYTHLLFVHFPTDVLAGIAVGFICAFLAVKIQNGFLLRSVLSTSRTKASDTEFHPGWKDRILKFP